MQSNINELLCILLYIWIYVTDYNYSGKSPTENSFLQIVPQEGNFKGPTGRKWKVWEEDQTFHPTLYLIRESNLPLHGIF